LGANRDDVGTRRNAVGADDDLSGTGHIEKQRDRAAQVEALPPAEAGANAQARGGDDPRRIIPVPPHHEAGRRRFIASETAAGQREPERTGRTHAVVHGAAERTQTIWLTFRAADGDDPLSGRQREFGGWLPRVLRDVCGTTAGKL
jgi:hypothetical protein